MLALVYLWDAATSSYIPQYVPASGAPGVFPAPGEPVVGPDDLRELVESIRSSVANRLQTLAGRIQSGDLTNLAEFKTTFAEELKQLYTTTHVLARGGYEQMTPSAWGQLGSALKEQYQYLSKLVRDLENGFIGVKDATGNVIIRDSGIPALDDSFLTRTGLYTDSAWGAAGEFERVVRDRELAKGSLEIRLLGDSKEKCQDCLNQAALGWQPPGVLRDIGDTECGPGCRCHFEYKLKDSVSEGNAFYGKSFKARGNWGHVGRPGKVGGSGKGVTSTPEFKKWFGKSKVVDTKGNPLMVYRGDRPNKTSFTGREDPSNYIQGNIIFSDSAAIGKFYTAYRTNYLIAPDALGESDGLYRVFLSFQNPLVIDAHGEDWASVPIPRSLGTGYPTIQIDDLAVLARKKGYDGLIVKNVFDQAGEGNQYVAFHPTQIKSATGNSGKFNPKNPNITKSFNENQPRVPAGSPSGGEWASQGGIGIPAVEQPDPYPGLNPPLGWSKDGFQNRAALAVSTVLAEMKAKGYLMPERAIVERTDFSEEPSGETSFNPGKPVTLTIKLPDTLPEDANLDDAVKIAFGKKWATATDIYDEFTLRNFKDMVIHEMGHVQKGVVMPDSDFDPISDYFAPKDLSPKETEGKFAPFRAAGEKRLSAATRSVSRYASYNPNDFVAEAFTRLYRGEKLTPDAQTVYKMLRGPKIL